MTDATVEEGQELVIKAFEAGTQLYGMRKTLGHVYAIIYLEDRPVTFTELADETDYSNPVISDALHSLLELQVLEETDPIDGTPAFDIKGSPMEVTKTEFPAMLMDEVDMLLPKIRTAQELLEDAPGDAEVARHREKIDELERSLEMAAPWLEKYEQLPADEKDQLLEAIDR